MMAGQSKPRPQVLQVELENIPDLLKQKKRWVAWSAGATKPNGKFDKVPVDPFTGRSVSPIDPSNWLTIDEAMNACQRGVANGIGIVLSDQHPFVVSGVEYYLTAIDLDNCTERIAEHKMQWRRLGRPYVEISPSGKGLRMLGLSRTPIRGGNAGEGKELYGTKRFVTVTGIGARGTVCDFTTGIIELDRLWFGNRTSKPKINQPKVAQPARPELRIFVEPVLAMLDAVSSDTDYENWRDIIWSIASTNWVCARVIAHKWSRRASQRYDGAALDNLFDDFDPGRGITIATLAFHARKNGWTDNLPPLMVVPPPPPLMPLLMTAQQLRQIPATPYLVRGVLPAQGLAAIYGEPGSGKSFLALHLAHTVALGIDDWFGFPVQQAPVIYIALEGQGGIGKRISALEKHSKKLCPDQLRFWSREIQLLSGEGLDALVSEILAVVGKGAVVIVDTLNQASPGAEENSSQDMGKIIANAKKLGSEVGGMVVLVHHAGKDRSRGLRGHSSLFAAMDTVIEVRKVAAGRQWCLTKAKDDTADQTMDFDLIPYDVGQDAYGPIISCAVQQAVHLKVLKLLQPQGRNQKAALAQLREYLSPGQRIDHRSAVRLVATVLQVAKGKEQERAKDAVDALIRSGHLILNEEGLCFA